MHSRATYRKFIEELRVLVHEITTDVLDADQMNRHLNTMRALLRKIGEESKAKASDLEESREVIEQAKSLIVLAQVDLEYCFVMVHPKFGEIGADGPWGTSLSRVKDRVRHVDRKKFSVKILKRNASTKEVLGNVEIHD